MTTLLPEDACNLCRTIVDEEGLAHLIDIGTKHSIIPETMVVLCDVVADLAQCRHEGRPRSLALLVGEEHFFEQVLHPSIFTIPQDLPIKEFQKRLRAFSGLLDGRHVVLTVDRRGKVLGIKRIVANILGPGYEEIRKSINPVYTGVPRHLAIISKMTQSLGFFVSPHGNLVKVFDQGSIVALYTMGDWHSAQYEHFLDSVIQSGDQIIASIPTVTPEFSGHFRTYLIKIARVAFLMSSRREGTILSLDVDLKPAHRKTSRLTGLLVLQEKGVAITDLEDEELANLASLDGAVLIDGRGRILEFNAILSPAKVIEGECHYGARHETAINYSAERKRAIILVVSEDGGLTAFFQGQKVGSVRVN